MAEEQLIAGAHCANPNRRLPPGVVSHSSFRLRRVQGEAMAIKYEITRLPDGRYNLVRTGASKARILSFARLHDLQAYLKDSVSDARLGDAVLALESTGRATVESDLE